MSWWWKVIGGLVFLALVGCGTYAYFHMRAPKAPAYDPYAAYPPSFVENHVIGTSVEGREIREYSYGFGPKRLLFVGGMHGGYEWNSILLAYQLIDYLDAHNDIVPTGFLITVIPNLNPDGIYKIIGKGGRFAIADVPTLKDSSPGRFNAHGVDLNRNFDCKWTPTGTWRTQTVSAGIAPFSEPETRALRDYILKNKPTAAVFWHSQANAVYASECTHGILPETVRIMNAYASAAGYPAVKSFSAYEVHGDAEGWLASINIPAITVELKTHESVEWNRNLLGIKALLSAEK